MLAAYMTAIHTIGSGSSYLHSDCGFFSGFEISLVVVFVLMLAECGTYRERIMGDVTS